MVGEIPLGLGSLIDTLVLCVARGKRADAPARHQLIVNYLQNLTSNLGIDRHLVSKEGAEHVRTNLQMLSGIVHIVSQIAGAGVPEGLLVVLPDQIQYVRPFLQECAVFL